MAIGYYNVQDHNGEEALWTKNREVQNTISNLESEIEVEQSNGVSQIVQMIEEMLKNQENN